MENSSEKYIQWWERGKEELEKLPQQSLIRADLEVIFSDLYISDLPCPEIQYTDEEIILEWKDHGKNAVIGVKDGIFHMILPELNSGSEIPFFPQQLVEFKQWFSGNHDLPQKDEEFKPSPTPARKEKVPPTENIMSMMNNMMKTFKIDEMFEEMERDTTSGPEVPPTSLDPMGEFFQTILLGVFRFLIWLVNCVSSRIRIRGAIKGIMLDTMKDIQEGYWNDILSSPDNTIYEWSPRLHACFNVVFRGMNMTIRHRLIVISLLMFFAGYRCASIR